MPVSYEVREEQGYVWIKPPGVPAAFPTFDVAGFVWMCTTEHVALAPLETTVDNFSEIEHTPTTHAVFGYELDRMNEVTVEFRPTDDSVTVVNAGPPKSLGFVYNFMLGINGDYKFHDEWTTYFSPVYGVYDHWWQHPGTGREGKVRWRMLQFFTPIDADSTRVTSFTYAKSSWPGPTGGLWLFRWLLRKNIDYEIGLDVGILAGLADKRANIEGMKLSRFDRVLGLNRERIERVYRANTRQSLALAE